MHQPVLRPRAARRPLRPLRALLLAGIAAGSLAACTSEPRNGRDDGHVDGARPATQEEATDTMTDEPDTTGDAPAKDATAPSEPATALATLGAGCFWCVEAVYDQLDGVHSADSGYMGGTVDNPTYEQVCSKTTGHIEVVQVRYDPARISYEEILAWFWKLHDPTTRDRQGNDVGPQYRSVIFTHGEEQARIAKASLAAAQPDFDDPIVTDVRPAERFWVAEDDHQGYYFDNKSQGYCRYLIAPKLEKLGLDH